MGRTWKEQKSGHTKNPNKNHPHKDSKFYKDEFHERKGEKHKKRFDKFED